MNERWLDISCFFYNLVRFCPVLWMTDGERDLVFSSIVPSSVPRKQLIICRHILGVAKFCIS
ncbi:hypothetical protein T01_8324 [Trichinella spiralis]|uniref:Uncharacterized protein n=1 Tax=Trichinella spiralis TaxID=6334 RepID=A0A0V1AXU0_TRISP|nr:hypothetical protein T01_8324 [Trichinella spiralis]